MIISSAFLEINLNNLIFNYKYLSSLNKNGLTGATIKANAYGLGDIKIIKTLYKVGCRHFFVATHEEAINIRKKFKLGWLYVLNGIRKNDFNSSLLKNKIIPIINTLHNLKEISSLNKKYSIGIHVDTGINRLGISHNEIFKIKKNKMIDIKLIMSHFASSNEKNNKYNDKQLKIFLNISNKYFNKKIQSINNSAGLVLKKKIQYDLARPGIALYGGHNNTSLKNKIKPVTKVKAEILQIKKIKKNEFVGYNQTYYSKKNITIAIIGIGYADGISRLLSNKGHAYFKKQKFKIIGRISMDTITIDISNYSKHLKPGMFVDIINYQYDIEKMAENCNTISNEILTSISSRVKRVYIN